MITVCAKGRKNILSLWVCACFCWHCAGGYSSGVRLTCITAVPLHQKNEWKNTLSFTVNRLYVADKKECAREIIKKCRENDFQSVLFSYDMQKPTALYGTVYRFSWGIKWLKPLFTFRYTQEDDTLGIYNFIDNPEKFVLEID